VRILLDTHALFWSVEDPSKLSTAALTAIQDPNTFRLLSAATIWELAIKVGLGKLQLSLPFRPWMEKAISDLKLDILHVTVEYAERQAALPPHHKDPFDRMLIAQSLVERIRIVSIDTLFDAYGVTRLW